MDNIIEQFLDAIEYFADEGNHIWYLKNTFIEEDEKSISIACFWFNAYNNLLETDFLNIPHSFLLTNDGPVLIFRKDVS